MDKEKKIKEKRMPSVKMSFLVFGIAIAILLIGIVVLGYDIHMVLLLALVWACLASATLGYGFDDLVNCMKVPLGQSMGAMIIFIFIGIIIASWIYSGTVPALIYYGLKIINPKIFLPAGLLLCSLCSLATGTSWGTAGTMGIAMMGIGTGMGIPAPVTAGMVLSGAYFGDKMSPMSDTTNLAPAGAGTTVQKHINAMWKTTLPSYIICLIAFTIMGIKYSGSTVDQVMIDEISGAIADNFNLNIVVLLPMIVLFALNIIQFPAIPGMAIGSALGVIVAITFQGQSFGDVLTGLNYGFSCTTGVAVVDSLLNRGGIQSMMYTFSLACIAISFGGVMEQVGYLRKVIGVVVSKIKHEWLFAPIVILSTELANFAMAEVYLSLVLVGNLYRETFEERGLKPEFLSRLLEEGGTLLQVFIPWTTGAVFMATTLGVSVFEYAPYALLNWINPLISIICAAFGFFILHIDESKDKKFGRRKNA